MPVSPKGQTFTKRLGTLEDAGHLRSYAHAGHVFVIPTDQPANDTDPSGHLLFDLISAPEDLCTYNTPHNQDNTIQHEQDAADIWFSTNIDPSGQIHDSVRAPRILPPDGNNHSHTTENNHVSTGTHPHGVKPRISPPAGKYHTTENNHISTGTHPHGVKPRISPPAGNYHTTENNHVSAGPHPHGVKPVSGYLPSNTSYYQTLSTDTRSHGATPPPEHLSLGASHDLQMPHQSVTAISPRAYAAFHTFELLTQSGLPNYLGARIPLEHGFDIMTGRTYLDSYHDNIVCDFLEYDWPVNYTSQQPPRGARGNHPSATAYSNHG